MVTEVKPLSALSWSTWEPGSLSVDSYEMVNDDFSPASTRSHITLSTFTNTMSDYDETKEDCHEVVSDFFEAMSNYFESLDAIQPILDYVMRMYARWEEDIMKEYGSRPDYDEAVRRGIAAKEKAEADRAWCATVAEPYIRPSDPFEAMLIHTEQDPCPLSDCHSSKGDGPDSEPRCRLCETKIPTEMTRTTHTPCNTTYCCPCPYDGVEIAWGYWPEKPCSGCGDLVRGTPREAYEL